jgi:hypothetical protein
LICRGSDVTGDTYTLKGIATRGATVEVTTDRVPNRHGHWSKIVHLNHGENDFALSATKPSREDISIHLIVTRRWTPAEREAQRKAAARRKAQEEAAAAARKAQAEANYKGRAIAIPYTQLNKDADAQAGKIVTYSGQIFQIQRNDNDNGWIVLVSVTNEGYGLWEDHIWVDYRGDVNGAEGDIVTPWGKVDGSRSYETQIGGETYVPEVTAKYLDG